MFWVQHSLKDGSHKCADYVEEWTNKWSFFNTICMFLFGYNQMNSVMDPIDSITKRLWSITLCQG